MAETVVTAGVVLRDVLHLAYDRMQYLVSLVGIHKLKHLIDDFHNKVISSGDDAIFSTAVALHFHTNISSFDALVCWKI